MLNFLYSLLALNCFTVYFSLHFLIFIYFFQSWGLRPRSYDKTGLRPALVLYFWSCANLQQLIFLFVPVSCR